MSALRSTKDLKGIIEKARKEEESEAGEGAKGKEGCCRRWLAQGMLEQGEGKERVAFQECARKRFLRRGLWHESQQQPP